MATLEKRVQVLFSVEQYARLEAEAAAERLSVGAYIREAVDAHMDRKRVDKQAILQQLFDRADARPDEGPPIEWEEEKDAFDRDILREPVKHRQAS